jgi:predicted RNA-binding Zn-ribbon protein involved in translation (DUF1610 family)
MIESLRKDAVFDICPECKSVGVLRRSRPRNLWERIVKSSRVLNYYRCRECGWRGMKSNFSLKKLSLRVILFYIAFILFAALVVRFIILRFVMR